MFLLELPTSVLIVAYFIGLSAIGTILLIKSLFIYRREFIRYLQNKISDEPNLPRIFWRSSYYELLGPSMGDFIKSTFPFSMIGWPIFLVLCIPAFVVFTTIKFIRRRTIKANLNVALTSPNPHVRHLAETIRKPRELNTNK